MSNEFEELIRSLVDSPVATVDTAPGVPKSSTPAVEPPKPAPVTPTVTQAKPVTDKVNVPGSPFTAMVYPKGYLSMEWGGWRYANRCALYLDQLESLEKFFASPDYQQWKDQAVKAGLRARK